MDRIENTQPAHVAAEPGKKMLSGLELCRRCIEDAESDQEMHALVNNELAKCEGCDHQPVIHTLSSQFKSNKPRWWVVSGKVVVPIWVVEIIRKLKKF